MHDRSDPRTECDETISPTSLPLSSETAEKVASGATPFLGGFGSWRLVVTSAQPFLCGFGAEGGRDRVEVDEDGGPERLEA